MSSFFQNNSKSYDITYADPPWNCSATASNIPSNSKDGQPYNAMRMIDVYGFELPETNTDAVLFLLATFPLLPEALYTMKWRGFEYKASASVGERKVAYQQQFWGYG